MKKILSLFLALCMISAVLTAIPITAFAATNGTCGENLTWTLDDSGTLTISGVGSMYNYDTISAPWYSIRDSIHTVELNGVLHIGNRAFEGCSNITNINWGNSLYSIGKYSFSGCNSLTDIIIPNTVFTIGSCAFAYCTKLKSVCIGNNVSQIYVSVFMHCTALTSVSLPENLTSIGQASFYGCTSLKELTLPDKLEYIGSGAFSDCSSLMNIYIPDNVSTIHFGAFVNCTSLATITVDDNNQYFASDENGILYDKNLESLICCPAGSEVISLDIPDSVKTIYAEAFYNCDNIKSIIVPDGVTNIYKLSFYHCDNLINVTIPNNITSIGESAFSSCVKLSNIVLPNSVTTIGKDAFGLCKSFTNITIPNKVKSIDESVFSLCDNLASISIPSSISTINDSAFYNCKNLKDVYYEGDINDWHNIEIGLRNEYLTNASIHFLGNRKDNIGVFLNNTNKNGISADVSKFKIDSTYPADKADNVPGTFDLRLYFNKSIKSANANKKVKIIKSNGDVYKTLNADDGNINDNTITFPNISLPQGYTYSVIIDSGAYTSDFGDVFYGLQKGTFSFVVPPAADNHKVKLDYPGKYVFGLFGSNTDVPPIPKGSDSDYTEELQDWATAYGINSIAAYESPEKLLEIPVKNPVTDTRGQTFLLNDGGTTVKQVMDDLIFIENLKPYVAKMNVELQNVKLTEVSENLVGYDNEKVLYNNKIVPYAEQISEYLDRRNEKSSFFLSVATPLTYNSLLKSAASTLGANESMFVKTIADAIIDSIALEKELSTITGTKDYETFKSNLSDIKTFASAGKELYKIKTSGFSSSTAKLAIDLFDKYYTGENETVKLLSDARSSIGDVISCTKMSVFLGTSLGFMPMVVELNENLQKSLSDKIKAWFFISDYYIKDKYPNIYNYYFTNGGYEINSDFISMEWESTNSTSAIGAAAAREYQQCKDENDTIAVSWCDFADRTGAVKIRAAELLGVKRDLVNLGTIMKFVDTVDVEETKRCLLDYISATINKSKTSEFYGMCPIVVDVYDKNDNLLATLSSENEGDIESEYGSFYILGDNNETKYFIAASDEYRVEISAYDEGTMSVATVERDEFGNVVNTSYFKDISLINDSRFSLISTPDTKSVLTNLKTEANEAESVNSPEDIQLSCNTNEIAVGKTLEIKADIFPDFSQYDSVKWQVFDENNNDTSYATIENGMFVASEEGKYIIRATVDEDVYDEIIIDAYYPITQILCEYETLAMMAGEEKEIDLTTNTDVSSGRVIKKTSSNQAVAVVNDDGTITATGQGEATIKYSADDIELLLPVIVYDAPVEISLYQSDTDGMRFKIDVMNTSCQNSFVGTAEVNVLNNDELLETDTVDLVLEAGQVYSGFVDFDYLTASNNCYDIETMVYDEAENLVFKTLDIIDGVDYIVTLNIDDTTIEMSYAEFNEYTPALKEGHTFIGWYKDASYESSSKVEKLTSAYGREITLYGLWVSNKELVKANVSETYSDDELIVYVAFENLYVCGSAVVDIFESENDTTPIMSVSKEFSVNDTGLNFNIPFTGDNKEYILKMSFYDNLTDKNEVSEAYVSTFTATAAIIEVATIAEGNGVVSGGGNYYRSEYVQVNAEPFEKEEFIGWFNGDILVSEDMSYRFQVTEPLNLTAKFTANTCEIIFMDGENVISSVRIIKGETVEYPQVPDKDGYTFNGYYTEEEFLYLVDGNATFTEDTKLYAKYDESIYEDYIRYYEDYIQYYIKDDFAYIYKYTADASSVRIPVSIEGYPVSTICSNAFEYAISLWNILIPDTVTTIEENAFANCENLQDVYYIGTEEQWNEILIANGNETLIQTTKTYDYCDDIVSIYNYDCGYEDGNILIYLAFGSVYNDCFAYIDVFDAETNTKKAGFTQAIEKMTENIEMSFPLTADDNAYLVRVSVVNSETDNKTLCDAVKGYIYAAKQRYMADDFEFILNDNDEAEIESYYGDETDLIIPEALGEYTVTGLYDWGLCGSNISSIYIGEHITKIGEGALSYCYNLNNIIVDDNNPNYCSVDGMLYSKDKTIFMQYLISKEDSSFEIPEGVKVIGAHAFESAENIKTIKLPETLERIEWQGLACSIEGDLILPKSVTCIEKEAFAGSMLSSITIPSGTSQIAAAAFSMMPNLIAINVDANNLGYVSENGVLFKTNNGSLVKKKIGLIAYPAAKPEKSYVVPDGVQEIYPEAFIDSTITAIVLPISLKNIGEQAFDDCSNLKTICYKGNENQYSLLQIQNYNDWLLMADIVFNYDGNPNIISDAYAEFCDDTILGNVEFSLLTQSGTLFIAVYDKDGRLVSLDKKAVTPDEFSYDFEFEMESFSNDYTVKIFCWESGNTLKPLSVPFKTSIQEVIITDAVLESEHPYTDDCNDTQVFEYDGECTSLSIRFSEDCELEEHFDYVYIYDANDEFQCFTGIELANKTVIVPGNTVKIQLVSDGSVSYYGYKTKRIVVIK